MKLIMIIVNERMELTWYNYIERYLKKYGNMLTIKVILASLMPIH